MVFTSSYEYYVVVSIAFIQLAMLLSLLYQAFREPKKNLENEQNEVSINTSSTAISQFELDEPPKKVFNATNINEATRNINEEEIRVLSFLLSRGGKAYQAEIAKELGLPKSTVTRIVRRLYERGFITVRRVGRFSYVQITDVDYVSDAVSKSRLNQP
ncbi:MAG: helix-turn-helix transcriptional regulator [Vulcanisaeta sp. AZ3]|jgi:uncharacterized membrane protein